MCGIVGLLSHTPVNQDLYDALIALQHRGQDAAGMMTCDDKRLFLRKDNGLVRDVFHTRHMLRLQGNMGIAHVRYPTAGSMHESEAQPFYVNSPYGISLAHNGNLTNSEELSKELFRSDLRHLNTRSDSEVLLNVFAHELQSLHKMQVKAEDIFEAIRVVHRRCKGAYAIVVMIIGYGLVAFRDPQGIRPLIYGKRSTPQGDDYMFASESVALDTLGFTPIEDVKPGEAICIDFNRNLIKKQCADNPSYHPCIFEYVYLARPDSVIDSISVHAARQKMGIYLAEKILRERPEHDIDVVIPIPDTSRVAALPLAQRLGIPYGEGFVKNRYIGRTFIMPDQAIRQKSVRHKLNVVKSEFENKVVLLVDDSIVRGTTSKEIIRLARQAGARKVYFASAAPEVRYPNVYGVDMPTHNELIAYNRTSEQVGKLIEADWLIYQDLEDLIKAVRDCNPALTKFEISIFDGCYITSGINTEYFRELKQQRSKGETSSISSVEILD